MWYVNLKIGRFLLFRDWRMSWPTLSACLPVVLLTWVKTNKEASIACVADTPLPSGSSSIYLSSTACSSVDYLWHFRFHSSCLGQSLWFLPARLLLGEVTPSTGHPLGPLEKEPSQDVTNDPVASCQMLDVCLQLLSIFFSLYCVNSPPPPFLSLCMAPPVFGSFGMHLLSFQAQ